VITGLIRRRAVLATCRTCGAPILAGHDDDGLVSRADPTPLTRTGELLLHLAGRTCWSVEGGELVRRDRWRIRSPRPHVVPVHLCGAPIPDHARVSSPSVTDPDGVADDAPAF
jgi:hypothetical protein